MKHKLINKTREGAGLPYKNDGGGGGGSARHTFEESKLVHWLRC